MRTLALAVFIATATQAYADTPESKYLRCLSAVSVNGLETRTQQLSTEQLLLDLQEQAGSRWLAEEPIATMTEALDAMQKAQEAYTEAGIALCDAIRKPHTPKPASE